MGKKFTLSKKRKLDVDPAILQFVVKKMELSSSKNKDWEVVLDVAREVEQSVHRKWPMKD